MSDEDFAADVDPITCEAATWFATIQGGTNTDAERAAFQAWLRSDARHEAAYSDIERIWSGVAELPIVMQRRQASLRKLSRRTLGKTVVGALVGGGGWIAYRYRSLSDYSTNTGQRRTVTFADASRVELSSETALSAYFGPQSRVITLHHGEAFFSVARDPMRPFIVRAAEGRTSTISASFNVNYLSDSSVQVTAADNIVNVHVGTGDLALEAGSQVAYGRTGIGPPYPIDTATELAWREGRLVFLSQPLGKVITSINRWRSGNLIVMSQSLAERPVTLILDIKKSEDILSTLETALPLRIISLGPYIALLLEA